MCHGITAFQNRGNKRRLHRIDDEFDDSSLLSFEFLGEGEGEGGSLVDSILNDSLLMNGTIFGEEDEGRSDFRTFEDEDVELFTHHKTGEMLAIEAVRSCFDYSGLKVKHMGKSHAELGQSHPRMFVIHFVRDPFSLLVSAFNYHRANTTTESWLHSPEHALHALEGDNFLLSQLLENETYHEFLVRVPTSIGMQAETHRAFHGELQRMFNASRVCYDNNVWCKEVCLEDFVTDSLTYNATWASVLQFLGLEPDAKLKNKTSDSYLSCLAQLDLNNKQSDVLSRVSDHVTQGKLPADWNLELETEARTLDAMVYDSALSRIADGYGCYRSKPGLRGNEWASPVPIHLQATSHEAADDVQQLDHPLEMPMSPGSDGVQQSVPSPGNDDIQGASSSPGVGSEPGTSPLVGVDVAAQAASVSSGADAVTVSSSPSVDEISRMPSLEVGVIEGLSWPASDETTNLMAQSIEDQSYYRWPR